ncbi:hypothetical protein [Gimesia chilikensis]|uniref:hypothetical protein n=1 Tax=Gimesia chilikensis TaxID=2605989 RepID=UPI0011883E6D|nr:hypothetical protein [Gimesia chilikensis]MCR9232343.1 hypothetical protein [bacterium]QDT86550.1 hypothetical protein MalM14_42260 [Gimesia chilikensis]
MNNQAQKECHGDMFPDNLDKRDENTHAGKVFKVNIKPAMAGVLPVAPERTIEVDHAAWKVCRGCPEFVSCYQLSMAKIALQTAITVN